MQGRPGQQGSSSKLLPWPWERVVREGAGRIFQCHPYYTRLSTSPHHRQQLRALFIFPCYFYSCTYFSYLKGRETERNLLFTGSLPRCLQQPGLGPKPRLRTCILVSAGVAGTSSKGHEQEAGSEADPRRSDGYVGVPGGVFTCQATRLLPS